MTVLFELREYRTRPGQRAAWVRYMEETIMPFQISKGMVIVASFVGEADEDLYIWIRRFDSEQERERLYREVYESDRWKHEIGPRVGELIDRSQITVTRLTPTPHSVIR